MRRPSPSFIEAAGAVVAALCVAFVLEVPVGPSHGAEGPPAVSASGPAIQTPAIQVNRALKGDRLRVIVRPDGGEAPDVQLPRNPTRALPDGCESASGPILPATKPSRCVT
jgi:hypothetical protein